MMSHGNRKEVVNCHDKVRHCPTLTGTLTQVSPYSHISLTVSITKPLTETVTKSKSLTALKIIVVSEGTETTIFLLTLTEK
jgi:hypothetical protein